MFDQIKIANQSYFDTHFVYFCQIVMGGSNLAVKGLLYTFVFFSAFTAARHDNNSWFVQNQE